MNLNQWNNLSAEFLSLEKVFNDKYKTDFISANSNIKIQSASDNIFLDYKEYAIIVFIGSTVLHLIISLKSENVDFFSMFWFIFYVILSIISPGIFLWFKSNRIATQEEDVKFLIVKLIELEKIYYDNEVELQSSNRYNNVQSILKIIDAFRERTEIVERVILNKELAEIDMIVEKCNQTTSEIQSAASELFGNKNK